MDQLEELFTLNLPEVQERFASLLGRLAPEADVHVVLSLRDDFLIRCSDHEPLAPVFESLTPLTALSREGLRRAIVEPAKKRGYRFDDDTVVEEMVSAVEGSRGAKAPWPSTPRPRWTGSAPSVRGWSARSSATSSPRRAHAP